MRRGIGSVDTAAAAAVLAALNFFLFACKPVRLMAAVGEFPSSSVIMQSADETIVSAADPVLGSRGPESRIEFAVVSDVGDALVIKSGRENDVDAIAQEEAFVFTLKAGLFSEQSAAAAETAAQADVFGVKMETP